MSRCFPFPPPGYEKKASLDGANLIIKEKHKEKRHKDKKDKDKKERSERKEKESGEGKHKEDKDRKQNKHRNKKDKKKDKQKSSEEKKVAGFFDTQNGEKLGPGSKPSDGNQDSGILVELGKRVRNDDGASDSQKVQKITLAEQRKADQLWKVEGSTDRILADAYDNIMDKREHSSMVNGQRLKVNGKGLGNGFVGKFYGENQIKVEGGSCQVHKVEKRKEGKDKNKNGNNVSKRDGLRNEDQDKNRKGEDRKREKEKKKEKMEDRSTEKIKQRANDDNLLDFRDNKPSDLLKESHDSQGKVPKHEQPELNGFLHNNGIRPNNMLGPAFSSHHISQNGSGLHSSPNTINLVVEKRAVVTNLKINGKLSSSPPVIKNGRSMEPGWTANNSTAEHGRPTINSHVVSNGLISSHVGIGWQMEPCQTTNNMEKVEQTVNNSCTDEKFPSHPLVENGRKMAPVNTDKAVNRQGPDATCNMDNKEFRMNGMLGGKKSTSSATIKAKEKIGTSMKPPHPDVKYLSQILTVPKVEWPQFDDQEWLFGCLGSQAKRPKLASSQNEWTKQVWAEAIQVESAEVTAMPYVIPY